MRTHRTEASGTTHPFKATVIDRGFVLRKQKNEPTKLQGNKKGVKSHWIGFQGYKIIHCFYVAVDTRVSEHFAKQNHKHLRPIS